MIGYIVSGTVLAVSSVFNVGMTIYKHKDTIRKITKIFNDMGYEVDQKKVKDIFHYDLNEITNNKENDLGEHSLNQSVYESTAIIPILNLIYNKYNIEYLRGNYTHNEYYDILVNKLDTDFMEESGFITKKERTSADIDEDLMSRLEEMVKAQFEEETKSVSKNIEEEKRNLKPTKPPLELANIRKSLVNKYSFVQIENNFYSVPEYLVGLNVTSKIYYNLRQLYMFQ